jgi:hypothetical protein
MKKNVLLSCCLLVLCFFVFGKNVVFSQELSIDSALDTATNNIRQAIEKGTRVAVINIFTEYTEVSDYIINELIVRLVNLSEFQVIPRSSVELTAAQSEIDFQMSGYVNDGFAQSLGKFLGAQTIITGTFSKGTTGGYRLIINAIDVESFTYRSSSPVSIKNDPKIRTLITGIDESWKDYLIYLGGRGGGGFFPSIFYGDGSSNSGFNATVSINYQIAEWFGLQTELMYSLFYRKMQTPPPEEIIDLFPFIRYSSFVIPILMKFTPKPGNFSFNIIGGVYFGIPVPLAISDPGLDALLGLDFGFAGGFNFGYHVGPGILFIDIRSLVSGRQGLYAPYPYDIINISLGYEVGVFKRK